MKKLFGKLCVMLATFLIIVALSSPAFAGHVTGGGYCVCGCPSCICDPGEQPELCTQSAGPMADVGESFGQAAAPISEEPSDFDFGSGALLVALAFFAWTRFRAATF